MSPFDVHRYRSLFPHVKSGLCYLNHAAVSPFSSRVADAVQRYLVMKSDTNPEPFEDVLRAHREAKVLLGKLLNCSADRIAILDNTSNGLNIVATGIAWRPGDRVLLNDMEFPSNVYPFLNLRRLGVEVDFVRNVGGRITPEALEAAITPRTRLLSISHVQFLHGFRADLKSVGEICRGKQVIFSVDAIQSAGAVPLDVQEMNIDFLAAGAQKWLMAPEGTAFAYITEELQEQLHPAYLGWMNMRDFFSDLLRYRIDLDPSARRFENGTFNCAGVYGLRASLELLLEVGIGQIEQRLHMLGDHVLRAVAEKGVQNVSPEERSARAGIITFRPRDAQAMFARLQQERVHVSLREGCIRFSPHFYNTEEEIHRALDVAFKT